MHPLCKGVFAPGTDSIHLSPDVVMADNPRTEPHRLMSKPNEANEGKNRQSECNDS